MGWTTTGLNLKGPTGATGATGAAGTTTWSGITDKPIDPIFSDQLTTGDSTIPRRLVNNTSIASGNGVMRLTYFTATKTETITQIRNITGTTAAAGATLCRIGIYTIDGSGNLTLAASTANDTNLWTATSTAYTKALSSSFSKVKGTRYAVGLLVVGASTAPIFQGQVWLAGTECFMAPALAAQIGGQTDLPSTVSVGSLSGSGHQHYMVLLP